MSDFKKPQKIIKDSGKVSYSSKLQGADIIVGGSLEKFVPNINVTKWSGRAWLNLNHKESIVGNEQATLSAGKVSQKVGQITHEFYEIDAEDFEYNLIFDSNPGKSVTIELDYSTNLIFARQEALTQSEIDSGMVRPDRVVGSYAVYIDQSHKFCHIYYPYLIDANGTSRRAQSFEIKNKKLTITDNFNGLVFPVAVDPTIGYSTRGGTSFDLNYSYLVQGTTSASSSTLTNFGLWINYASGSHGLKMAIYKTSDRSLVEYVSETPPLIASPTERTIACTGLNSLEHSTEYTIAAIADGGNVSSYLDTVTSHNAYVSTGDLSFADAYPATLPAGGSGSYWFSLYAEYDESASGYTLTAESVTFTLTGSNATLLAGRKISAESGAFALTGSAALLLYGRKINAESGTFALTGSDADLVYTPLGHYTLTCDPGTFILTGYDATLTRSGASPDIVIPLSFSIGSQTVDLSPPVASISLGIAPTQSIDIPFSIDLDG